MRYAFRVEVEVERSEGKFATWEEFEEQLRELLDVANPDELTGDHEGTYTITSWEVSSEGKPVRRTKIGGIIAKG